MLLTSGQCSRFHFARHSTIDILTSSDDIMALLCGREVTSLVSGCTGPLYLSKEALRLVEDMLQLCEVHKVLLEGILVGSDFPHLPLQHFKCGLKIQHVCDTFHQEILKRALVTIKTTMDDGGSD